jgi:hypothetical protein
VKDQSFKDKISTSLNFANNSSKVNHSYEPPQSVKDYSNTGPQIKHKIKGKFNNPLPNQPFSASLVKEHKELKIIDIEVNSS